MIFLKTTKLFLGENNNQICVLERLVFWFLSENQKEREETGWEI